MQTEPYWMGKIKKEYIRLVQRTNLIFFEYTYPKNSDACRKRETRHRTNSGSNVREVQIGTYY